jgi:SagB-type dehydrogenase family enzyme
MIVKTNPNVSLECYPDQAYLIISEPKQKRRYLNDNNIAFLVMQFCLSPRKHNDVIAHLNDKTDLSIESIETLLFEMFESGLLISSDSKTNELHRSDWFQKGWTETWYYHNYTHDYPFKDYSIPMAWRDDQELMKAYATQNEVPDRYKNYDGLHSIYLPLPKKEIMDDVKFSYPNQQHQLNIETLSILLYLNVGQIGTITLPIIGESLLKTSPSGGARHPTETYIYALDIIGLETGLYHYCVKEHSLKRIATEKKRALIEKCFSDFTTSPDFKPKIVFILSECFKRSMWRYREPRSMRAVLFDLGHIVSTIKHVGTSFGFKVSASDNFDENLMCEELLLQDDNTEMPMYMIAYAE